MVTTVWRSLIFSLCILCSGTVLATMKVDNFVLLDQHGAAQELYYQRDARAIVIMVHGNGCQIVRSILPDFKAVRADYEEQGVRFTPGGVRPGAAGHRVCFIHPKGNEAAPIGGEGVLIESSRHAAVLFVYVCNLKELSLTADADGVIKWLSTVYAAFDEVLQRDFKTAIVKIETQHDHFLAVSGIFEPDGMAADLCVDAACRMAQAIADVKQPDGLPTMIKLGVSAGPLSGGVVGMADDDRVRRALPLHRDRQYCHHHQHGHGGPASAQGAAPQAKGHVRSCVGGEARRGGDGRWRENRARGRAGSQLSGKHLQAERRGGPVSGPPSPSFLLIP